jgi:hypothetical protein
MGCQTEIADQIVQRGGNYVLALKGNQPTLYADVQALFADARAAQQAGYGRTSATETVMGHGRVETRTAYVISDPEVVAYLNEGQRWRDLASVALIEAQRTVNGTTTIEQRYYLLNQRLAAATVNDLGRCQPHSQRARAPEYGGGMPYSPQSLASGTEQGQPQIQALPRCA